MSLVYYQRLCNRYRGRAVEIRTRNGKVHRGIIQNVDGRRVYIRPIDRTRSFGGYGYGFFGPYRYGTGFGIGIALGLITSLVLLPLFF